MNLPLKGDKSTLKTGGFDFSRPSAFSEALAKDINKRNYSVFKCLIMREEGVGVGTGREMEYP